MNIETNQLLITNYELQISGEKYFFKALCW